MKNKKKKKNTLFKLIQVLGYQGLLLSITCITIHVIDMLFLSWSTSLDSGVSNGQS